MAKDQNDYPDGWLVYNSSAIAGIITTIIIAIVLIWGYYYYVQPGDQCITKCDEYNSTFNESGCYCIDPINNNTVLIWEKRK